MTGFSTGRDLQTRALSRHPGLSSPSVPMPSVPPYKKLDCGFCVKRLADGTIQHRSSPEGASDHNEFGVSNVDPLSTSVWGALEARTSKFRLARWSKDLLDPYRGRWRLAHLPSLASLLSFGGAFFGGAS